MASVQVATVAVVFGGLPTETQAAVFGMVGVTPGRVPAILGALLLVVRLVDQPKTRQAP